MPSRPRSLMTATGAAVVVALCAALTPAASEAAPAGSGRPVSEPQRLSAGLAAALQSAGFDALVDYDHVVDGTAQPASTRPNVDLAVIELDRHGRVAATANVLYDRDSPDGYQVKVDQRTLETSNVQFSRGTPSATTTRPSGPQGQTRLTCSCPAATSKSATCSATRRAR